MGSENEHALLSLLSFLFHQSSPQCESHVIVFSDDYFDLCGSLCDR